MRVDPRAALLAWYDAEGRDLPWRRTRDPYRILVSEVMCQQTQVARVIPFYEAWIAAFPTAAVLAAAPSDRVHRLWKGLGYPSRADRLQAACLAVCNEHGGRWPDSVEGLLALPGIGPYTARAVAAFAFAAPVAVLDTNVARVLARRDGLLGDRAAFQAAADLARGKADPRRWNNAMMELGATICTARKPNCERCPWRRCCQSVGDDSAQLASAMPLKVASPRVTYDASDRRRPEARIVLALIHHEGRYLAARRPAHLPAGGAWELPGGKREAGEADRPALAREIREELGADLLAARPFLTWREQNPGGPLLELRCYRCRLFDPQAVRPLSSDGIEWFTPPAFAALPFPPANAPFLQRFREYHRLH